MSDVLERPSGGRVSGTIVRYHDEGDGSYSESIAAHIRIWNTDTLAWERWDGAITFDTTDIQIGAVEIKDGSSDNRASVSAGGALAVDGSGATQPVSIAADVTTKEVRAATPTVTQVADSASSVTLLASNTDRLGSTIYNSSTAVLYVKLGSTASTSSFTVQLNQNDYYEVPYGYTGVIDGIWASDAGGNAYVTELEA